MWVDFHFKPGVCWPRQSRFGDHVELIRRGSIIVGHLNACPPAPPTQDAPW